MNDHMQTEDIMENHTKTMYRMTMYNHTTMKDFMTVLDHTTTMTPTMLNCTATKDRTRLITMTIPTITMISHPVTTNPMAHMIIATT